MTDRPIPFTAPMIRALLAGTKTQTRRPIKPSNSLFNGGRWTALHKAQTWDWEAAWVDPGPSPAGNSGPYLHLPWQDGPDADTFRDTSHRVYPVIQPGDRLWVKEAWRCNGWATDVATIFYRASETYGYTAMCEQYPVEGKIRLIAGGDWKPPMFMPRWASRITLTVTDVRVQRVQDISEADAVAEGIQAHGDFFTGYGKAADQWMGAYDSYASLWISIHGTAAWDANPWVWAYSFTVAKRNIDAGASE